MPILEMYLCVVECHRIEGASSASLEGAPAHFKGPLEDFKDAAAENLRTGSFALPVNEELFRLTEDAVHFCYGRKHQLNA